MTKIKANREKYIDAVKGFTIILVVLHHVVSGTNAAMGLPGWFMVLYKLTVPIRMPLFFLVAGFFAKKHYQLVLLLLQIRSSFILLISIFFGTQLTLLFAHHYPNMRIIQSNL